MRGREKGEKIELKRGTEKQPGAWTVLGKESPEQQRCEARGQVPQ